LFIHIGYLKILPAQWIWNMKEVEFDEIRQHADDINRLVKV
jgi:hypothetical protein